MSGAGRAPTPLWTEAEQRARSDYDLTAPLVFQGFAATIAGVNQADSANQFVVKTLFARADSTGRNIRPIALQRLYATLRNDRWELSSALPRLTAGWTTTEVDGIVYHAPPGWVLDQRKASHAARFVDSLSRALRVDRPGRIDYYLTRSSEEMYRVLGMDFFVLPSGPGTGTGGKSYPRDGIVISGDPDQGEAYFHELTHVVAGREAPDTLQNTLVNEGLATWLGGSRGRPYGDMVRWLEEYQRTHPKVRFYDLIMGRVSTGCGNDEADALYATGALIIDVVHTDKGIWGVKKLLSARGPNIAVEPLVREILQIMNQDMDSWWRTETLRAQKRVSARR